MMNPNAEDAGHTVLVVVDSSLFTKQCMAAFRQLFLIYLNNLYIGTIAEKQ